MGVDYLAPTGIRSPDRPARKDYATRANFRQCFYLKNADWNNNKKTFCMKELLTL